jgi:23S rRNA (uridine2552-2'-O)-methyltransferase
MATRKRRKHTWLREHARDAYVRRAQEEGYRSRAVYKLIEIDRRYRLLHPGQIVIDLGAAPGGWSQYARRQVGASGRVLAVDVAAMSPLVGVELICGDIADPGVLDLLAEALAETAADLVISDMAPNISGDSVADQARMLALGERVLAVATETLRNGGELLVKAFQGEGFAPLRQAMQPYFDKIYTCKPQASRSRSREIYLLGQGFHRAKDRL